MYLYVYIYIIFTYINIYIYIYIYIYYKYLYRIKISAILLFYKLSCSNNNKKREIPVIKWNIKIPKYHYMMDFLKVFNEGSASLASRLSSFHNFAPR